MCCRPCCCVHACTCTDSPTVTECCGCPVCLGCGCVSHAGLPFAICSIFLAEPVGVPRQLLPYGLKQLLDIASNEGLQEPWPRVRGLLGTVACHSTSLGRGLGNCCVVVVVASHRPTDHCVRVCLVCAASLQVHAFNTLRVVFNDSNMAMDSSGFHAAGVVAAINGMTAPAWEVRLKHGGKVLWQGSGLFVQAAASSSLEGAPTVYVWSNASDGGTAQAAMVLQACC